MSRKHDQQHRETNAMVLGNGVSFAVLESMFNVVQTQSVLAANMVKGQDPSYVHTIDALARSLNEMMSSCSGGSGTGGNSKSGNAGNLDSGAQSNALGTGTPSADILGRGSGQSMTVSNATELELLHEMIEMLSEITKEMTEIVRENSNGKLMVY